MDRFNFERLLKQVGGTDPRKTARAAQEARLKAIKDRASQLTAQARTPPPAPAAASAARPGAPSAALSVASPWNGDTAATGDGPWASRPMGETKQEPDQPALPPPKQKARAMLRRGARRSSNQSVPAITKWIWALVILWIANTSGILDLFF